MSEMIERVARAMFKVDYPDNDEEMDALFWDRKGHGYLDQARAAIEAMRKPTEAMESAAFVSEGDTYVSEEMASDTWAAMIDAALK